MSAGVCAVFPPCIQVNVRLFALSHGRQPLMRRRNCRGGMLRHTAELRGSASSLGNAFPLSGRAELTEVHLDFRPRGDQEGEDGLR